MFFLRCFTVLLGVPLLHGEEPADPFRFEKQVLVERCSDPLQLDVAPDGRVFFIERAGALKVWDPVTQAVVTLVAFPALVTGDAGALGLALAPDFDRSGHIFLARIPLNPPAALLITRVTLKEGQVDPASEVRLLEIPLSSNAVQSHCGCGLAWDGKGNLLIGVGDNMPPQDLPAVHPADPLRDARGTAGNSMELRGKVLRITPRPDGSYAIPSGNLFTDSATGRPEIYAMGVRNPFRVSCDPVAGWITWGDVGGNVNTALDLGPEGFDEINITRTPGFFGWPFCSGPNTPWRSFDPATRAPAGAFFDPLHILNDSPRNAGLKALPPAQPAAFYYSSAASQEWPFAGSGGRSITGGLFYRKPGTAGDLRLPDSMEGKLIFAEWMRNWVAAAQVDESGMIKSAESFLAHLRFRRPADLKLGPDGALYLAECGDQWSRNTGSQVTRVIYRRGNRPPVVRAAASKSAGKLPLEVGFSAAGSSDPDKTDVLTYTWDFGGGHTASGPETAHVFNAPGVHPVTLKVSDAAGLTATAALTIMAGNEAPSVRFTTPVDGGFFEYGKPVEWKVEAMDAEDGVLPAERVLVQGEQRERAAVGDTHPGFALMKATTCFACHSTTEKSAGPPYAVIAAKYAGDAGARDRLAGKIISGGAGTWGELPMPPHPQHSITEATQMADWVLSLAQRKLTTFPPGSAGRFMPQAIPSGWGAAGNAVIALTASAPDGGAGNLPPQSGEAGVIQRARRQRAAYFDRASSGFVQDNLEQGGLAARIPAGGWICFEHIQCTETRGLKLSAWPQGPGPLTITVHAGTPDGQKLAQVEAQPGSANGKPGEISLPFTPSPSGKPTSVFIKLDGPAGSLIDIQWAEFLPPTPK